VLAQVILVHRFDEASTCDHERLMKT